MQPPYAIPVRGRQEPAQVGKMIAFGGNYSAHVREMGGQSGKPPVMFLKPASALVLHGGVVRRPAFSLQLHHELELVVVIGKQAKHISSGDAPEHVLGFAVGLDMTLRDVQTEAKRRGHPWSVAKGFDTSAPVSEIIPRSAIDDPMALEIELLVNDEQRQQARIADLSLPLFETVAHASRVFQLDPGDLIFTGTPAGVAAVFPGDILEAHLKGWTSVRVTVADDESGAPLS